MAGYILLIVTYTKKGRWVEDMVFLIFLVKVNLGLFLSNYKG